MGTNSAIQIDDEELDIQKQYKILEEKCDVVITKIKARKTNGRKKKQGH
jgi:hypothetical protein